jgi:hypothetical protein
MRQNEIILIENENQLLINAIKDCITAQMNYLMQVKMDENKNTIIQPKGQCMINFASYCSNMFKQQGTKLITLYNNKSNDEIYDICHKLLPDYVVEVYNNFNILIIWSEQILKEYNQCKEAILEYAKSLEYRRWGFYVRKEHEIFISQKICEMHIMGGSMFRGYDVYYENKDIGQLYSIYQLKTPKYKSINLRIQGEIIKILDEKINKINNEMVNRKLDTTNCDCSTYRYFFSSDPNIRISIPNEIKYPLNKNCIYIYEVKLNHSTIQQLKFI